MQKHILIEPVLISNSHCLIKKFPFELSKDIIADHQLIPSARHGGYLAQLKMLNSLKRIFGQLGLAITNPPNISFKMFKSYARSVMKRVEGMKINDNFGPWTLLQHQQKSIQFFLENECRVLLADQWGMGKTVTSLACFYYAKIQPILIICPKILLPHWFSHLLSLMLHQPNITITVIDQQLKSTTQKYIKSDSKVTYTLVSAEQLEKSMIQYDSYAGLIVDEFFCINQGILTELKNSHNIIILGSISSIGKVRQILPYLNMRISHKQVIDRYGSEEIKNYQQFQKAIFRHYLLKHTRIQYRAPTLLKKVSIYGHYSQIKAKNSPQQLLGLAKIGPLLQYLQMLRKVKQIRYFYLIYVNQCVGDRLYRQLRQGGWKTRYKKKKQKNTEVWIWKLQQAVEKLQQIKQNEGIIILIQLYNCDQKEQIDLLCSQLYLQCQRIQYLVDEQNTTQDQLIYPTINYKFEDIETISSCQDKEKKEENSQYPIISLSQKDVKQETKVQVNREPTSQKRQVKYKQKLIVQLVPNVSKLK